MLFLGLRKASKQASKQEYCARVPSNSVANDLRPYSLQRRGHGKGILVRTKEPVTDTRSMPRL